jgi:outer membrane protein assembly factor BamB
MLVWSNHYGGNPSGSNEMRSSFNLENARFEWEIVLSGHSIYSLTTTNNEIICITRDAENDKDGTLYSFSIYDGKLKWKMRLNSLSIATTTNDMLIIGQKYNKLVSINSKDGKINWEYVIDNSTNSSEYQIFNPIVTNNNIYFASTNGKLYCFDLKSKSLTWASKQHLFGFLIYDEKVISYYGKKVSVVDVNSGKLISEFQLDEMPDKMPTSGKNKYLYWTDDILYCHNLQNGKLIWKKDYKAEGSDKENCNISISNDGKVLLGADFGTRPLICLDVETGKELWRNGERRFIGGICSFPTIANNKVYIAYDFRYFAIYSLINGKELFRKELYNAIQGIRYLPVVGKRIIFNHIGNYDKRQLTLQSYRNIANKIIFKVDSNKLLYEDEILLIDATPKIIKGVTYIPARYIVDSFGGKVSFSIDEGGYFAYDPKKGFYITNEPQRKIVETELGNNKLELVINSNTATLNDKYVLIDKNDLKITPIIINGRTMVPLRFLAESLGCKVEWKSDTKEIIVTYQP